MAENFGHSCERLGLCFILYILESHWKVLRKDFLKLYLVAVWRVTWGV